MVIGKGSFCAVAPFPSFPPPYKGGGERRGEMKEGSDFFGSFPGRIGKGVGKGVGKERTRRGNYS
jgi:hypothetical protein